MKPTFGQHLRELRTQKDLSLRDLAGLVEKSAPFILDLEKGNRFPSEDLLGAFARIFGTTIEDLKQFDHRMPTDDMRDLIQSNAQYGYAFRKVVDAAKSGMAPEQIMEKFQKKGDAANGENE
jgi:transcriptional regulator with XRE-family HTH domain